MRKSKITKLFDWEAYSAAQTALEQNLMTNLLLKRQVNKRKPFVHLKPMLPKTQN